MPFVIILGMHRSGTSFLTRSLHEAGLQLGDGIMGAGNSNLEGHWESVDVVETNDRILEQSGGSWHTPPASVRCDDATRARMAEIVERFRGHAAAGWKDPRTTVTFPLWKPLLPEHQLVAALRHPMSVARSLAVREDWPLERGLNLWADYNEHLLRNAADDRNVLWFDFDADPDRIAANVREICDRLGLACDGRVESLFNPYLRHHQNPEPIPDRRVADLYERLKERAGTGSGRVTANPATAATRLPSAGVSSGAEPATVRPDGAVLLARLEQLARVQSLQDAALQAIGRQTSSTQAELILQVQDLQKQAKDLQARVHGLQVQAQDLQRRLLEAERKGLRNGACLRLERAAGHVRTLRRRVRELESRSRKRGLIGRVKATFRALFPGRVTGPAGTKPGREARNGAVESNPDEAPGTRRTAA